MQLNELRKDLRFNTELLSLVETLKNVAGSQYHLLEKKKQRFEAFMDAFSGFFRIVNLVEVRNPLVVAESPNAGLILVTSDSGFMGGLNSGIIRAGLEALAGVPQERRRLIVIGDKGAAQVSELYPDSMFFPGINQDDIYPQAVAIKDAVLQAVMSGEIGMLSVAYARALSFSAQTIEVIPLLPCGALFDASADSDVARHSGIRGFVSEARRVIVESSYDDMVTYLASQWVVAKLYEVFEDSKLAEFSARAMHLEGSLQKVEKEHSRIRQKCFKASHELVDKGMRESFAAKSTKRKRQQRVDAA